MICEAREGQLGVVFALMSLAPRHVRTFYDTRKSIDAIYAMRSRSRMWRGWLPAGAPDGDGFGDALQLNEEGAKQFSRRLGAWCGNVNQLNSCCNEERLSQEIL